MKIQRKMMMMISQVSRMSTPDSKTFEYDCVIDFDLFSKLKFFLESGRVRHMFFLKIAETTSVQSDNT